MLKLKKMLRRPSNLGPNQTQQEERPISGLKDISHRLRKYVKESDEVIQAIENNARAIFSSLRTWNSESFMFVMRLSVCLVVCVRVHVHCSCSWQQISHMSNLPTA